MDNVNKPKVRFPGFDDNWEQRRLGDIFKYEQPSRYIVNSTDYDDSYKTPVLTAGQSFILGYTDETEGIKDASADEPVIIFDDFTTSSHYVDFPFKVKSSAMKILTLKKDTDDIYCAKNVLQNLDYAPTGHERHWISIFSDFDVLMPTDTKEQVKIGVFFRKIDNLIELYQRKRDLVIAYKLGLLDKMFPKDNELTPESRFPEYSGEWKEYSLGDIYSERNEKGNDTLQFLSVSIHTGVSDQELESEELGKTVKRSEDKTKYKRVYKGDLVFNMMRAWQGAIGVAKSEGMISPAYISAIPNDEVFPLFMDYALRRKESIEQINNLSYGVTDFRKRLYWSSFVKVKCMLPSKEEQEKIWRFLKQIDNLIDLYQQKIKAMTEYKKGLLQQMFI